MFSSEDSHNFIFFDLESPKVLPTRLIENAHLSIAKCIILRGKWTPIIFWIHGPVVPGWAALWLAGGVTQVLPTGLKTAALVNDKIQYFSRKVDTYYFLYWWAAAQPCCFLCSLCLYSIFIYLLFPYLSFLFVWFYFCFHLFFFKLLLFFPLLPLNIHSRAGYLFLQLSFSYSIVFAFCFNKMCVF